MTDGDYTKVAHIAQLGGMLLKDSSFEINPLFYSETDSDSLKYSFGAEVTGADYSESELAVQGHFEFSLLVKKGRSHRVKIKAAYVVFYSVSEAVEQKDAEAFCNKVGIFTCYPYFRQLVSVYSDNSGARLPILPLLTQANISIKDK